MKAGPESRHRKASRSPDLPISSRLPGTRSCSGSKTQLRRCRCRMAWGRSTAWPSRRCCASVSVVVGRKGWPPRHGHLSTAEAGGSLNLRTPLRAVSSSRVLGQIPMGARLLAAEQTARPPPDREIRRSVRRRGHQEVSRPWGALASPKRVADAQPGGRIDRRPSDSARDDPPKGLAARRRDADRDEPATLTTALRHLRRPRARGID